MGGGIDVGYVKDLNYAQLIEWDKVWEGYKIDNDWTQVCFVEDAANFSSDALKSAIDMAILGSPRPPSFINTPCDYLSINTIKAINAVMVTNVLSNTFSIKVYGADMNHVNIAVMVTLGSHWMATAGKVISEIGVLLVRTE